MSFTTEALVALLRQYQAAVPLDADEPAYTGAAGLVRLPAALRGAAKSALPSSAYKPPKYFIAYLSPVELAAVISARR